MLFNKPYLAKLNLKFKGTYSKSNLPHPLKSAMMNLVELSNSTPISVTHMQNPDHKLYVVNGSTFNRVFQNHKFFKIMGPDENTTNIYCDSGMYFMDQSQLKCDTRHLAKRVNILDNSSVHVIVSIYDIDNFYFMTDKLRVLNTE